MNGGSGEVKFFITMRRSDFMYSRLAYGSNRLLQQQIFIFMLFPTIEYQNNP